MIYAGDSWALKGFTETNHDRGNQTPDPEDRRMADHWGMSYVNCLSPGRGNLSVLDRFVSKTVAKTTPVIWIYTEPGRDYGRITGKPDHDWIASSDIFAIRQELDEIILRRMAEKIPNPVALIGGLSDVNEKLAAKLGFTVLHPSWQRWMSDRVGRTDYFKFGWGASDIGWRQTSNGIRPSREALFAWDELVKEWCLWEDFGYMCHEHPTPKSNQEFAEELRDKVTEWLSNVKK